MKHSSGRRQNGAGGMPLRPHSTSIGTAKQASSNPEATLELLRGVSPATVKLLRRAWEMTKTSTRETQVKLTVSVPPSLHVLLRSWALCEGRELTSVVLQCVELSVRQLKSNGSIPSAAIRAYEGACDERLAVGGL